eukprot:2326592-Lingulodinium_polyedra.AAC.1
MTPSPPRRGQRLGGPICWLRLPPPGGSGRQPNSTDTTWNGRTRPPPPSAGPGGARGGRGATAK